eukprot:1164574-Prymnesium_polylepis.1
MMGKVGGVAVAKALSTGTVPHLRGLTLGNNARGKQMLGASQWRRRWRRASCRSCYHVVDLEENVLGERVALVLAEAIRDCLRGRRSVRVLPVHVRRRTPNQPTGSAVTESRGPVRSLRSGGILRGSERSLLDDAMCAVCCVLSPR